MNVPVPDADFSGALGMMTAAAGLIPGHHHQRNAGDRAENAPMSTDAVAASAADAAEADAEADGADAADAADAADVPSAPRAPSFVLRVCSGVSIAPHAMKAVVDARGGYDAVVEHKKWQQVRVALGVPPTSSSS